MGHRFGQNILLVIGSCLIILTGLGVEPLVADDQIPVPEFFGLYVVHQGTLIELTANPSSGSYSWERDESLLPRLVGPELPNGDVYFIAYSQNSSRQIELPAIQVGRVEVEEVTSTFGSRDNVVRTQRLREPQWIPLDRGITLKVAPIPADPERIVRLVPTSPLPRGVWGIRFEGRFYDFRIGPNGVSAAQCISRNVHLTGNQYSYCKESAASKSSRSGSSYDGGGGGDGNAALASKDLRVQVGPGCKKVPEVLPAGSLVVFGKTGDWRLIDRDPEQASRVRIFFVYEGGRLVRCAWADEKDLMRFNYQCGPPASSTLAGTTATALCPPFENTGLFSRPQWLGDLMNEARKSAQENDLKLLSYVPKPD